MICSAHYWTGYYMIGTSVMKELMLKTIDHNTRLNPADIYLFKFNNRNARAMREVFSKLTIKTPE